jgi:hypothetical protein
MSYIDESINDTLEHNSNDFNGVREILRKSKADHKNIQTKDLNQKYHIPGYKFIKRDGILQLIKDGLGGTETKDEQESAHAWRGTVNQTPIIDNAKFMQSPETPYDDRSETDSETTQTFVSTQQQPFLSTQQRPFVPTQQPFAVSAPTQQSQLHDFIHSTAETRAQNLAQKEAQKNTGIFKQRITDVLLNTPSHNLSQIESNGLQNSIDVWPEFHNNERRGWKKLVTEIAESHADLHDAIDDNQKKIAALGKAIFDTQNLNQNSMEEMRNELRGVDVSIEDRIDEMQKRFIGMMSHVCKRIDDIYERIQVVNYDDEGNRVE